eukprot:1414146-Prymnesium_polylepis.1
MPKHTHHSKPPRCHTALPIQSRAFAAGARHLGSCVPSQPKRQMCAVRICAPACGPAHEHLC